MKPPKLITHIGSTMEQIEFPQDFSEFLKLLNAHHVEDCVTRADMHSIDGRLVPVISFNDLKINKRASGRAKDLDDLENLP